MVPEYTDIKLVCKSEGCGKEFVWTSGEQVFMFALYDQGKLRGEVVPPKRCKSCRIERKRKAEREAVGENY